MAQYKSLRDMCRYRNWNSIGNKSMHSDPIWWSSDPPWNIYEMSGLTTPAVFFEEIKGIMRDHGSDCLKVDAVDRCIDNIKYNMKLSNNCTRKSSDLRNKIYELV